MEFTKLSDVEVVETPTDTANVLIEENGVIKKAPKTAVSGGYDAVITLSEDSEGSHLCTLTEGSYETLKSLIDNGEVPNVLITGEWSYGDVYKVNGHSSSCCYNTVNYGIDIEATFLGGNNYFRLMPDGTLTDNWE